MTAEWSWEQNQNVTLTHTWDGRVNKAGFSVLHQPNVAIPLMGIGKSQRIAPDILMGFQNWPT